jgi:hypothetical protein
MNANLRHLAAAGLAVAAFAGFTGTAHGQIFRQLVQRAGLFQQPAPVAPLSGAPLPSSVLNLPQPPVLPPGLNLTPQATNSLLNGLNANGTALRPGNGWLVNDLTHQGVQGQQLANTIHQLQPYKQNGVLTFPQNATNPGTQPPFTLPGQAPTGDLQHGQGHHNQPQWHPGNGHGRGRGSAFSGFGRAVGKGRRGR